LVESEAEEAQVSWFKASVFYFFFSETEKPVAQCVRAIARKSLICSSHPMALPLLLVCPNSSLFGGIFMTNITRLLCFCAALIAFQAPPAKADATYTYAGNAFTGFFGSDSCVASIGECQVTGTITLAAPLAPNMTVVCCGSNVTAVSFSFTDGVQTVNNTNGLQFFDFGTNSSGMINAWNVGTGTFAACGTPAFDCIVIETTNASFFVGDTTRNHGTTPVSEAFNNNDPGTWSSFVSTIGVPEPSVLVLLGTGLCALVGGLRKRLA
jgi:hypothetical protein